HDAADEEALVRWWQAVRVLVTARFRATEAELHVRTRGHYSGMIGFPLPGTWKLVAKDRRWSELEQTRPHADVEISQTRRWHAEGGARDVTTRELVRLVHERRTILVDARPAPEYAEGHLPGAVSLPID